MTSTIINFDTVFSKDPLVDDITFIKLENNIELRQYLDKIMKEYNKNCEILSDRVRYCDNESDTVYLCELFFDTLNLPNQLYVLVEYKYKYRYSGLVIQENNVINASPDFNCMLSEAKQIEMTQTYCNGSKRYEKYPYILCYDCIDGVFCETLKIFLKNDGTIYTISP